MANEFVPQNDGYKDSKGRKPDHEKLGGPRAAAVVCVVEILENMVFLCNASNFVAYFLKMNYSTVQASNMVTNFSGTSFLLTLLGGFISDSFLTRFKTFVISCVIELAGIILLTVQANVPELQPSNGKTPSGSQAAVLYIGLYAMALGVGGIKSSLPAHGADQLDQANKRQVSAFFNWYFFCLCTGGFLSSTVMVWVEENKGWKVSFIISAVALAFALCIFMCGFPIYRHKEPSGSPLSRVFKVFASAICNWNIEVKYRERSLEENPQKVDRRSYEKFKCLNKALIGNNISIEEVTETRTFLGLLPIFASTIVMNCCLAQLFTFSVHQGLEMDRKIGNFQIPTQSLSVLPLSIMLLFTPIYDNFSRLSGNKLSAVISIFQPLKRIGIGLALASASMAVAAGVEVKRRNAAEHGEVLSVYWLGFQYILIGVSDMLTLGGMLEFFYSEAPENMRSISTALSWASTSLGYFLSSVIVSVTNSASGKTGIAWLGSKDLNQDRLDLFYTVLCVLNFINLLNYIFWARRY